MESVKTIITLWPHSSGSFYVRRAHSQPKISYLAYLIRHPVTQSRHKYIDIAFLCILRWWPALSLVAYIMNTAYSRMLLESLRTTTKFAPNFEDTTNRSHRMHRMRAID
jgi:hypothetical protein